MSPSIDWTMSSLVCAEYNNELLDANDEPVESSFTTTSSLDHNNPELSQDHNNKVLCVVVSDECLDLMIENEYQHLPECDYLARLQSGDVNLCGRMNAVCWIKKVHAYYRFGPLTLFLSINYLDRFLSAHKLPADKAWIMQLLAVATLSIAAKMEETNIPLTLDFQVADSEFIFEARTIQKMEVLVLSTLQWRMQAVTPFSFLDSFLYKLNGDQRPPESWLDKSIDLILSTVDDIEYVEFRGSEVAAAVAIAVTGMNHTTPADVMFQTSITNLLGLVASKERVVKVIELLHDDLVLMVNSSSSGSLLLDDARLRYKKSETTTTSTDHFVDSCASSSTNTRILNNKRRKV